MSGILTPPMTAEQESHLQALAAAAGLDLSKERRAVLAASVERVRALLDALAAIDYGDAEPAARFRPLPMRKAP